MESARSRPSFHSSRMSIKSGTSGKFKRSKSAGDGPPSLVVHPATEDGGGPDGDYDGDGSDSNWLQKTWRWIIEHLMMVAIALLLLGGVVFIVIYFVLTRNDFNDGPAPAAICLTPSCVLASAGILQNLSPRYKDIDPCTNFDQYVCEGFNEKHDLRPDQGRLFTGTLMAENGEQILRHLLEAPYSEMEAVMTMSSVDKAIFDKLQDAYSACLDESEIKKVESAPLIDVLKEIERRFGAGQQADHLGAGFAQSGKQQPLGLTLGADESLNKVMTYLATIGVTALVDIGTGADDRDPDVVVPFLNAPRQPGLPSKQYYEDSEILENYAKVIGQVLEGLLKEANSTVQTDDVPLKALSAELVEKIVHFEHTLARATPATEEAEDPEFYYNPMTLDEISTILPQFSLDKFIQSVTLDAPKPAKIIVGAPSYLQTLSTVLNVTSAETLQAYFVWKTVQRYAYKVEDDALKPLKRFNNELQGKDLDATPERWRTCVQVADRSLGWILSRFFVQKSFSEGARLFGDQIVSDIKREFVEKLENARWMSEGVRKLGVEKVHAIDQKIGYPIASPDIRNASDLDDHYAPIHIKNTTYFANTLSVAIFDTAYTFGALGYPTNRAEWGMTADTVNAYYNPPGNEIVFPAGIMQKPVFYPPDVPQYLTYGAFGAVSGHELSHAFDSTGRHYDERGNYTDWWDEETVENFKGKASCFVEQYGEFVVGNPNGRDLHVNGRLTLGENIADVGGVNAAFKAWKRKETSEGGRDGEGEKHDGEGKKRDELLPGLQAWTREQLFFISYANWWCGKARPEYEVEGVFRDPHAPTWARILGTMENSRDFKEAFNCPVKEPRCELW